MDKWDYMEALEAWDLLPQYWRKMSKDQLRDYLVNLDDKTVSTHFKRKKAIKEKLLINPELNKRKSAFFKINYKKLNSIQKANYNFNKISGSLVEYGFNKKEQQEIMDFMFTNKDRMREISLRMVTKLADLKKSMSERWTRMAECTCMKRG